MARRKKWKVRRKRKKEVRSKVDRAYKTYMFPKCSELIKARDIKEAQKIRNKLGVK